MMMAIVLALLSPQVSRLLVVVAVAAAVVAVAADVDDTVSVYQ